jgi:hypothetical protein
MCMFWGSRAWSKWGVVHRSYVLLVCRKLWFYVIPVSTLGRGAIVRVGGRPTSISAVVD